jgi:SNF2 family DNA or RNA helicase
MRLTYRQILKLGWSFFFCSFVFSVVDFFLLLQNYFSCLKTKISDEAMTALFGDTVGAADASDEIRPHADVMLSPLHPYQRRGLKWLRDREMVSVMP